MSQEAQCPFPHHSKSATTAAVQSTQNADANCLGPHLPMRLPVPGSNSPAPLTWTVPICAEALRAECTLGFQ